MYRFIRNTRLPEDERTRSTLTVAELEKAEEIEIRRCQEEPLVDDLRAKKPLPSQSRLSAQRPLVDKNRALCAGARLEQAPLHEVHGTHSYWVTKGQ